MFAAGHGLGDIEIAAADSVAGVQNVELGECAHRRVAHGQKGGLTRVAYARADILGEFVRVGDGLYAHFGSARPQRDVDRFCERGKARMDVENDFFGFVLVFAAARAETLKRLYDGAFGVGNRFELVGDSQKGACLIGYIKRETRRHDASEEFRYFLLNAVENILAAEYVLDFVFVGRARNRVSDVRHHFNVARRHELNFAESLFAGDLRRKLYVLVDVGQLCLFETFGLRGDHPGDERRELLYERKEDERCRDVERRVDDGHRGRCGTRVSLQFFGGRALGGETFYKFREEVKRRRDHYGDEKRHQYKSSDDVEERVGRRGAFSFGSAVESGEPCGHGRADVHAEYGSGGGFERDDVLGQQRHRDRRSRGGTLDNGREHQRDDKAFQKPGDRTRIERSENLKDGVVMLDRLETFLHPVKTHEHETEAHKRETDVVGRFFIDEEVKNRAKRDYGKPQKTDAGNERDKPCCSGCTDVRAYNNVNRLSQIQESRRYESYNYYGNDRGGLHDYR